MKNSTEPKVFELDADQSYNIDAVKQGMKELAGVPISGQQLWMNGKELLGNTALSDLPEGFELSLNPISGVVPTSHCIRIAFELHTCCICVGCASYVD